jgi:phage-related protein
MDQGGAEGIRDLPGRRPSNLYGRLDDRGRRWQSDIAKPQHGMGSGVLEIALRFRGDAFRVIYAVQLAEEIWVVHAFQKKSTQGIKTPKREVDLIKDRLKRLKEILR